MTAHESTRSWLGKESHDWDVTSFALVLMDANWRYLDANRRGRALLTQGQVLHVQDESLHCTDPELDARWHKWLASCPPNGGTRSMLLHAHESPTDRYSATINSLDLPPSSERSQTFVWRCLIAPLGQRRLATSGQLMGLFGFTPAEARLARAIANGDSLEAYAQAAQLKLSTVKTHLRCVFSKSGTTRQSALVHLITAIPPVRD